MRVTGRPSWFELRHGIPFQKYILYEEGDCAFYTKADADDKFNMMDDEMRTRARQLKPLDDKNAARLEKIKDMVIYRYGSTGVHEVSSLPLFESGESFSGPCVLTGAAVPRHPPSASGTAVMSDGQRKRLVVLSCCLVFACGRMVPLSCGPSCSPFTQDSRGSRL